MVNLSLFKSKSYTFYTGHTIKPGIYTFLNSFSYFHARRNPKLFNQFDGIFADGFIFVHFYNLFFHKNSIKRVSFDMTSIADEIFNFATYYNKSLYLIGAKEDEIKRTASVLAKNYKGLNICGYRDGYLKSSDERKIVISEIIKANPDIVVAGMGTPLQEEFLIDIKQSGWDGIGFTCGGFLHQTANGLKYYPDWINKYSLRWLYRLIKEPHSRMRVFRTYTIFPLIFSFDAIKYKLSPTTPSFEDTDNSLSRRKQGRA